jgi:hypothetical protein
MRRPTWTTRRLIGLAAFSVAVASILLDLYLASRGTCHVAHYWIPPIVAPPILLPIAAALVAPWRAHTARATTFTLVALIVGVQIFFKIFGLGASHC